MKKTRVFYGWVIVAISGLTLFFSGPGQTYSVSLFVDTFVEGFGWSSSAVSAYYSIATLSAGLMLPIIGRYVDKRGHRKSTVIIAALLGMTCLWMSFVVSPWMLFVGFMMLRLMGQGSMSLLPSTLVPQWFESKRARALSLVSLGGVLGSALLPVINANLIINFGAPFAWRVLAIALFVIMVPFGWKYIRDTPKSIGEVPDGKGELANSGENALFRKKIKVSQYPWTLKETLKTRTMWMMLFCMVIPSMINTGITFHMVSIVGGKGYDARFAAYLLSIVALVQFPVTFAAGYILDFVKVNIVKAVNYGLYIVVIIALLYSNNELTLVLYAVAHGIFTAFDSVSTGVLWPNYFGLQNLASIRSVAMTAMVLGSALGPLPFGFAYDTFNSYNLILWIMVLFPALGVVAMLLSPQPSAPSK